MGRYCTYFDHRFLNRGLAMIRSLRRFDADCRITVLCLTETCEQVLARLDEPGVTLIRLEDFERDNPDLFAIKDTRCLRDYYFTLSGCLVASVLRDTPPNEFVTYLDADLLFYASPAPIYAAMENASVGLIGHRHHWWAKRLEKYGRFNVGWVSFRADAVGREAAQWWRSRCIEWCYGCVDGDRFADQKYLDHIYAKFPNVVEVTHPGTNLGPWNICRHSIAPGPGNSFVVDGRFPLIFFHYSGLMESEPNVYLCSNVSYLGPFSRTVRQRLYQPYIGLLKEIERELGAPSAETPQDLHGLAPRRRRVLAPLFRLAGKWAGHYISAPPRVDESLIHANTSRALGTVVGE